jgi:hypothetical protein
LALHNSCPSKSPKDLFLLFKITGGTELKWMGKEGRGKGNDKKESSNNKQEQEK